MKKMKGKNGMINEGKKIRYEDGKKERKKKKERINE